ncbi:MAG: DUF559 domain-containing protein [Nanoarchaeota archaeon]|mgnify:CR=1 FL=1
MNNKIVWNKNLTKENSEWAKRSSERMKENNPMKNNLAVKKRIQTLIEKYGSVKGWTRGVAHKEETKRKIGEKNKNNLEAHKKISETRKKLISEGKIKISVPNSRGENNGMYGKFHSKETKIKMSEFRKKLNRDNLNLRINYKEMRKNWSIPKKDTSIEIKIQKFLKELNIEFFTHQYIKEIEHGYQCDILIPSMNLVIECFGDYWHKYPIGREIDVIRTKELLEKGFKLLVFWEKEINLMELNEFKNKLKSYE